VLLCGAVIDIDAATGKAKSIVRLQERWEPPAL
jgi:calcineurin-like phosphoesterase